MTRLAARSPKFFNILKGIALFFIAVIALALFLNVQYSFEWETINIYKSMQLTDLMSLVLAILVGVFASAALTVSENSPKREDLKLVDKTQGNIL